MILGESMFHLAKTASEDKLFDKWVLEKQACLDKDYLPRFSKELSSIKKLRKLKIGDLVLKNFYSGQHNLGITELYLL